MKKEYEFRIWTGSTSAVEHTISQSNLRSAPTVGGQLIDIARGRTQSQPTQVEVLDDADFFSSKIADSGGRLVLLGRLADVRVNIDGAGMKPLVTGRLSDIVDHVTHFNVTIEDERYLERRETIFQKHDVVLGSGSTKDYLGTIVYPAGLADGNYGPFRRVGPLGLANNSVRGRLDKLALVLPERQAFSRFGNAWNHLIRDLVNDNVKGDARVDQNATAGNFREFRVNLDGTDFEVASLLGSNIVTENASENLFQEVLHDLEETLTGVWVVDPTTAIAAGSTFDQMYFHLLNAPPSEMIPLHIGGSTNIHPFQLARDIYDEIGVRYSSTAFDDLTEDPTLVAGRWRITEPANAGQWLEDHIYGPYSVMPFINSSGEVAPRKITLPQAINSTDLFEFTATNSAAPHPEPHHSGRDMITAIKFQYTFERQLRFNPAFADDWSADRIQVEKREIERTHDRLDSGELRRRELTVQIDGTHQVSFLINNVDFPSFATETLVDVFSREIFERYGDGPLEGSIVGLSTAEDVEAGDFARVTIPTFLAPSTQGRGATRIVQIMSKRQAPDGPSFDWIDTGANLSALGTPTLTLAQSTSDANHSLIATVTGAASSGGFQIQLGSGSAEPASSAWGVYGSQQDGSSGTPAIKPLASGTTWFARARTTAIGRIRSAWSTAGTAETAELTSPDGGGLLSTGETGSTVDLEWSLGETDYPLEIRLSTGGASTSLANLDRLPAKSTRYSLFELALDTTYTAGVRHFDLFGGVGAEATATIETTTTLPTAPTVKGMVLLAGSECS